MPLVVLGEFNTSVCGRASLLSPIRESGPGSGRVRDGVLKEYETEIST
jgi:hypothetical protein